MGNLVDTVLDRGGGAEIQYRTGGGLFWVFSLFYIMPFFSTEVGIPGHQVPGSDFDAPVRRIKTLFCVF